jgi:hypothetical protein
MPYRNLLCAVGTARYSGIVTELYADDLTVEILCSKTENRRRDISARDRDILLFGRDETEVTILAARHSKHAVNKITK